MNRAERRRQKKAGIKVQKEPTLNLKVSDFDHMVSHAEKSAKERATAAAIHEIDRQILEHDEAYSLDIDAMVLWTLHVYLGFGKKRLERFYRDMLKEHIHMREVYEMDDTYRHPPCGGCGLRRKSASIPPYPSHSPHKLLAMIPYLAL